MFCVCCGWRLRHRVCPVLGSDLGLRKLFSVPCVVMDGSEVKGKCLCKREGVERGELTTQAHLYEVWREDGAGHSNSQIPPGDSRATSEGM